MNQYEILKKRSLKLFIAFVLAGKQDKKKIAQRYKAVQNQIRMCKAIYKIQ